MTKYEIKYLRNIYEVKYRDFSDYRTNCSIPDSQLLSKVYHPIIISSSSLVYDYTETAKKYLKNKHITSKSVRDTFLDIASDTTQVYDLSTLSIKEVQEIIDRNNYLFTKITQLVKENELIDKINSI